MNLGNYFLCGVMACSVAIGSAQENRKAEEGPLQSVAVATFFERIHQEIANTERAIAHVQAVLAQKSWPLQKEDVFGLVTEVQKNVNILKLLPGQEVPAGITYQDLDLKHKVEFQFLRSFPSVFVKRLKTYVKQLNVLDCIARRDTHGFARMNLSDLEFTQDFVFFLKDMQAEANTGEALFYNLDGVNALSFVLYHSVLDKSQQDKQETCAMVRMCCDKGIALDQAGLDMLVVHGHISFPGEITLDDLVACSSEEVQDILAEYRTCSRGTAFVRRLKSRLGL